MREESDRNARITYQKADSRTTVKLYYLRKESRTDGGYTHDVDVPYEITDGVLKASESIYAVPAQGVTTSRLQAVVLGGGLSKTYNISVKFDSRTQPQQGGGT